MFLNNRHHDPTLGNFVSVDPLVVDTGLPYMYTAGDPINYSDPSGLCVEAGSFTWGVDDEGFLTYTYVPMGGPECYDASLDGHETSGKGTHAGGYGVSSVPGFVDPRRVRPIPGYADWGDIGRVAGQLSDDLGWVATGCLAAIKVPVVGGAAGTCAAVAGGASLVLSGVEVTAQALDGDVDRCSGAGLAIDLILPVPTGSSAGEVAIDFTHSAVGNAIDVGCD